MKKFFFKSNDQLPIGLDVIRIISGVIIFSFGLEMFNAETMDGYTQWLTDIGMPLPGFMAHIGKLSELVCGSCLAIGLFTRMNAIPLMITMCVINFIMLDGELRTGTFYLLLIFASFFFLGSGRVSIDYLINNRKSSDQSVK